MLQPFCVSCGQINEPKPFSRMVGNGGCADGRYAPEISRPEARRKAALGRSGHDASVAHGRRADARRTHGRADTSRSDKCTARHEERSRSDKSVDKTDFVDATRN
jgi:hypothetical protein